MRYVILRDDDTCAATPCECLELLYRPFLHHGFPINLAAIPNVRTDVMRADGRPEGFLGTSNGPRPITMPIGDNARLVRYLLDNPGFHIVQHGYHHLQNEFDAGHRYHDGFSAGLEFCYRCYVAHCLDHGTKLLCDAGFPRPTTFVAPYDQFSRPALEEAGKRFPVISTGWFELRRLPISWWPRYLIRKGTGRPHWRAGRTILLSHPGCLLSCCRPYDQILDRVIQALERARLTVLVTHWWEYFCGQGQTPDQRLVDILHEVAAMLAKRRDTKVVAFSDVARGEVPLN